MDYTSSPDLDLVEIIAGPLLLRIALDLRLRTSLVFLEGFDSYNFDYSSELIKWLNSVNY